MMKAFRKHWNKEIRPYIHNPSDRLLAEYWWRAALGEALKHETDLHSTELGDWMRKELEGENETVQGNG